MTTPEATPATLQDAVELARAEIIARGDPDPFAPQPVQAPAPGQEIGTEALTEDDQAPVEVGEQDQEVLEVQETEDGEQSEELFADLASEPEEEVKPEETQAPTTPAADAYEVPGHDEPVPVQELINGYLRQADYTRKTQEIARDREANAKAMEFYNALTQHPKELAAQLAAAAGFIEPGAAPLQVVDLPFRPAEDVDAEIERRVQEAIESHPDIEEARNVLALQAVDREFAAIEADIGKPLGPQSRKLVLEEAVKRGTDDLRLVFDALMQRQQEKARSTEQARRAAPVKPTGKAQQQVVTADPETALDAVALAAQEAGVDLDLSQLNFR